jgi:hypothetical protein
MLLLLIPIAWLSIVTLILAACRMAAKGDARPAPLVAARRAPGGEGLAVVVWEMPAARAHDRRSSRTRWRPAVPSVR